jgi:quercetin dioxygenase-like cupin family protein
MATRARIVVLAALAILPAQAALGQTVHALDAGSAVRWGPAPPFFAAGARFAVLEGDPSGPGVYTVRLELPAGYVIKPHFHPTDENVTVLSGSFVVGMGDTASARLGQVLNVGGFISLPAQAHHFAMARTACVVQVHGEGPFAITYVRAEDDPRSTSASR